MPAACISILEVSLVPPAVYSKMYDASKRTGPEALLKVIFLFGSYATYALLASILRPGLRRHSWWGLLAFAVLILFFEAIRTTS